MKNSFTDYSKKLYDAAKETNDGELLARYKHRETAEQLRQLAATLDTFGGKRFLGLTKDDNEVWISYTIDRKTLDIEIKSTHKLSSIVKKAPKRVTVATGEHAPDDMMRARGNDVGAVTDNVLRYMQQLLDLPQTVGKVKGKCTSQLFMYASNAIYEGKWGLNDKKVRWIDILQGWELPAGKYFTIYG